MTALSKKIDPLKPDNDVETCISLLGERLRHITVMTLEEMKGKITNAEAFNVTSSCALNYFMAIISFNADVPNVNANEYLKNIYRLTIDEFDALFKKDRLKKLN